MPLFDGTRLFYNRGYGLLIAFYILMKKLDSEQIFKYNIIIELQKASIAIGDALLLINKKYHYLYNQRGAHFFSLIKKKEFLLKDKINIKQLESLYIPAIEGKLKPNSEMFNVRNYEKLFEIRDAFLDFFLEYESSRLKMSFNNWITYSEYILKNDVNDPIYLKLRRKLKEINIKGNGGLIQKQMLAILPHLLLALKNDFTLDDNYLNNVIAQINDEKIANIVESNYDLLGYFLETFHHDGVISAIIEYEKAKKYN